MNFIHYTVIVCRVAVPKTTATATSEQNRENEYETERKQEEKNRTKYAIMGRNDGVTDQNRQRT